MSSDDRPWRPGQSADPWLGKRLAHSTAVRRAEGQVYRAAWRAFRDWATRCESAVVSGAVTAAADEQQPDPAQVLALAWFWSELLDTDIVTALAWVMDDQYRAVLGDRYAEVLGSRPRIPATPGTQPPAGRSDAPVDADGHAVYVWDRDPYVHEHLATVRNQLANVPQETFDRITRDISEGVRAGETIPELAARVHTDLTADNCEAWRGRAVTVARTETIRAYNSGTDGAYGQLEAEDGTTFERRWLATIDTRTRETHREADGQMAAAGGTFTVGGWPARYPGDPNLPPEESVNCFPAETVVDYRRIRSVFRRWYEGDMVTVRWASGDQLTGTPNHPVLRSDGRWVPLGALNEGDHCVRRSRVGRSAAEPDPDRVPAQIGEVYRAAQMAHGAVRVAASRPDFHGDGANGEVEVVPVDGDLRFDGEPAGDEQVVEFGLMLADQLVLGLRDMHSPCVVPVSASGVRRGDPLAPRLVRGAGQPAALMFAGARHPDAHGGAPVAGGDTGIEQPSAHARPTEAVPSAQAQLAFAGKVGADQVIEVDVRAFRGHVYTLDTGDGWYIANGTAVRNCRCTVLYEKDAGETDQTNRQYLGAAATQEDTMARTLSGLIAPYEKPTGDGRRFKAGSLTNRDLPLPLQWQRKTNDGHYDAVTIGRITALSYGDDGVTVPPGGAELFDLDAVAPELADDVAHAATLIEQGVVGPSVDLDDFQVEFVKAGTEEAVDFLDMLIGEDDEDEADIEMLVTEGRICAATLVSIPAFAEVKLTFDEEQPAVVASVNSSGWASMPLADREAAWDAAAAEKRVADKAGVNGDHAPASAWSSYRKAFLWYDPEADDTKAGYKFQIADYDGDTLKVVPRGVFAAAGVLQGGRGGTSVPQADQDKMKTTLSGIYARMAKEFDDPSIKAPWDSDGESGTKSGGSGGGKSASGRSVTAAGGPVVPPLEWFHHTLTEPTPLTVTDEGQVYGHLAAWGTCHVGIGNACVTPPSSHNDYANFHTGTVVVDDGGQVAVGKITLGGGHADPRDGYVAAVEHYDDAGSCVAVVRAYEDEYGISVSGALVPGVTDEQVAQLRRSPLSGDWRSIGGNLELVAALAVNVPGFPVPTSRVAAGAPVSLVAAGMVPPRTAPADRPAPSPAALADVDTLARAMARGIRLDRESQERAAKRGELSGVFGKIAAERRVARRAALAETFGRVAE